MLRSLWKLQWKQFAARMKKGNGKKTSGGWLAFLMLFFVVCMEILMFVVFAELVPLCEMGLTWLYFAMAGTAALAFSMLGSVFMTQAQLYDAKDNERLLSMPIPPKYILLTRIAMLFTTTAGYTLAVSRQLVARLSSARDNLLFKPYQNGSKTPENQGFPGFYYI